MSFSVIAKNLKWEVLTKNLVTFKRWDGVKDEKYEDWLRNSIFMTGVMKDQHIGREVPKKGGLGSLWI